MEAKAENGGAQAVVNSLKQQNVQLQHILKYKDDVEIPNLKRQLAHTQRELQSLESQLADKSKQDEFLDRRTGIIHIDKDNRIVKINAYALEVAGTLHSQAIGRPIQEIGSDTQVGRPIFSDIEYHLEPEGKEVEWEKEIFMPNGEKHYFQMRCALVNGTRLITLSEITKLRISESRVKAIIGSSEDGIAIIDENSIIRSTNARFGKLVGLNWRQFDGMKFDIAVDLLQYHFKLPQEFMDFCSSLHREPHLYINKRFDMVLPHRATYQIYTRPISDEHSRIIGRVWFITDVSQFIEMEQKLVAYAEELEDMVKARTVELEDKKVKLEERNHEMETQLDMAIQVQQGMLPTTLPSAPGYEMAPLYAPTEKGKVSGDFYDVVKLDDDHIFFLMTDVSGHGVPAALVTAMAKMTFDRRVRAGFSVAEVLTHVNHDLCAAINTDHYLTAFAAILELSTGKLTYSRVCHPYPMIFRQGKNTIEHLQMRGGFFLGMFKDNDYKEEETYLEPGDLLFVYTDGINESFNHKDEQYGRRRLADVVQKYSPLGPLETVLAAQQDRERFSEGLQSMDDITLFAIKRSTPKP